MVIAFRIFPPEPHCVKFLNYNCDVFIVHENGIDVDRVSGGFCFYSNVTQMVNSKGYVTISGYACLMKVAILQSK